MPVFTAGSRKSKTTSPAFKYNCVASSSNCLTISVNVYYAELVFLSYDTSLSDIKRSPFESDTIEQDAHCIVDDDISSLMVKLHL